MSLLTSLLSNQNSPEKAVMFARMKVRKLCSAGRRGEAKAIIEQLTSRHTETVETRVTKAALLVDAGYVMESDAIFQALIAEYPLREDVRETFVRIAFSRGHLRKDSVAQTG
ncbi:hypothetical protein [Parasedimentitalea psychrophila]|uniref:Uncharacterized protein n=1 Tax=Parasedimentitalea psychrophila TaxID=2997337 RepID=A0A9Y2P779_9RHOB|nr:hypothetical protein [Parasedimentitalea psychrophila]WIY25758.1 hypothetical protein QPJ95_02075 [Parasedimentitalea psychrophila]